MITDSIAENSKASGEVINSTEVQEIMVFIKNGIADMKDLKHLIAYLEANPDEYTNLQITQEKIKKECSKTKKRYIDWILDIIKEMTQRVGDPSSGRVIKKIMKAQDISYDEIGWTVDNLEVLMRDFAISMAVKTLENIENGCIDPLFQENNLYEYLQQGSISLEDLYTEGSNTTQEELDAIFRSRYKGEVRRFKEKIRSAESSADRRRSDEYLAYVQSRLQQMEEERKSKLETCN